MPGVPPLIVVSGPSGVGKTTLVDRLLAPGRWPLRRAVTATTRVPRPGERDGVDYHFWSVAAFQEAVSAGRMLEYAVVFGRDYYGTPLSEVELAHAAGAGAVLVIDVQGAEQVRAKNPPGLLTLFVAPPSFEELRQRLEGRGSEDAARLARRLETARDELARAGEFDAVIVNADLAAAVAEAEAILAKAFAADPLPA